MSQGNDADGIVAILNGNGSPESTALADSSGNWLDDHRWKALRRLGSMAGWLIDPNEVRSRHAHSRCVGLEGAPIAAH